MPKHLRKFIVPAVVLVLITVGATVCTKYYRPRVASGNLEFVHVIDKDPMAIWGDASTTCQKIGERKLDGVDGFMWKPTDYAPHSAYDAQSAGVSQPSKFADADKYQFEVAVNPWGSAGLHGRYLKCMADYVDRGIWPAIIAGRSTTIGDWKVQTIKTDRTYLIGDDYTTEHVQVARVGFVGIYDGPADYGDYGND